MAGPSRPIPKPQGVDGRGKPGHDDFMCGAKIHLSGGAEKCFACASTRRAMSVAVAFKNLEQNFIP